MEEMREVAMAYYANMSNDEKQCILNFYQALDANGDGKVTTDEFLGFMRESSLPQIFLSQNLFKLLDANKDGTLDFQECVTLFFMGACCRLLFCDGCGSYLWGVHFLCVECYIVGPVTYDLCCSCYRNKKFSHVHSTFLDNYALLRTRPWKNESDDTSEQVDTTNEQVSSSRSIDRPSKSEKIKEAVEGVGVAYEVGSLAVDVASSCTIM